MEKNELRIAFFGESGAGKTTLVSSYFGNLQHNDFIDKNNYFIQADSISIGNKLLEKFYNIEAKTFPLGTDESFEYKFNFKVKSLLNETPVQISWLDYPGKWWQTDPKDETEAIERKKAIYSLLQSHVGFIFIDSEKYIIDGINYVKRLFNHFTNEIKRIQSQINMGGETLVIEDFPKEWIIAFTKSDVLEEKNAKQISKKILRNCLGEIDALGKQLNTDNIGHRLLLLSSVEAKDGMIIEPKNNFGLDLIAPLAFESVISRFKNAMGVPKTDIIIIQVIKGLKPIINLLDKLDDFLPKKYQVLTIILEALRIKENLEKGETFFADRAKGLEKKKKALESLLNRFKAQLANESNKRYFFQNQK